MKEYTSSDGFARAIKELRERVDSLERAEQAPASVQHRVNVTATSFPSPPYRPPAPVTITDLWAETSTAVSTDTTFALKRDGTSVGTVTVGNGTTTGMASIGPLGFDVFNVLTVDRTAGSADATVQAIGTSQHPITPSLSAGGCSPVPGGTIELVTATDALGANDNVQTSNAGVRSDSLSNYVTGGNGKWTAIVDCLLYVAYDADFATDGNDATYFGASVYYGTGFASSTANAQATTGTTVHGQAVIDLAAGESAEIRMTTDGTGTKRINGFQFSVLVVCSPAYVEGGPQ